MGDLIEARHRFGDRTTEAIPGGDAEIINFIQHRNRKKLDKERADIQLLLAPILADQNLIDSDGLAEKMGHLFQKDWGIENDRDT